MKNYQRYLGSIDICDGYNRNTNQYILRNVYSSEIDDSFSSKEKERLLSYLEEKYKLDEFQLSILKKKKFNRN